MGRGRGQAEHNQDKDDTVTAAEESRPKTDDIDEEEFYREERELQLGAQIQAEKTIEQILAEAHVEWTHFHYPPWAAPIFWILFTLGIINMVLTLDQWHGTRGWRLPFDVLPMDKRPGGWPAENDDLRFSGALIGTLGSCFTWVMQPSGDKYRCFFVFLLFSSLFLFLSFAFDVHLVMKAKQYTICALPSKIPDMQTHRYVCEFDEYQALCIVEFMTAIINLAIAVYLCNLALTGAVSRVRIWNEQAGKWEKKTITSDQSSLQLFPRRFRMQWPRQNLALIFAFTLNVSIVVMSATQSSSFFMQMGTGYKTPEFNANFRQPFNLYVVHGDEYGSPVRYGSWPLLNFEMRLSTGALAIVITAFTIQWRRDGRSTQLFVILFFIAAGILYLCCACLDFDLLMRTREKKWTWMKSNGFDVIQRRYLAVCILDTFLAALFMVFGSYSLYNWIQQAKNPGNPWADPAEIKEREANPTHPYGWYYNGEWAYKKEQEDAEKRISAAGNAPDK